jgi:predicted transcriptional regulator
MTEPREQIEFLAASPNRIRLLVAIEEEPARTADLTDRCDVSRWTVDRTTDKFGKWGWVETDNDLIETTGVGKAVLQKLDEISEDTDSELGDELWTTFKFFAESEELSSVYKTIINQPTLRPADVADQCGLSRSKVGNIISDLSSHSYLESERRPYGLADDRQTMDSFYEFEEFLKTINKEAHNEFLQYFEPPPDFPVEHIFEENSVTVSKQSRPHAPSTKFRNLIDTDIEQFYGLTPAASDLFHEVTVPLMKAGVSFEAVTSGNAIRTALTDFPDVIGQGLEITTVDAYIYSGDIPFALAVSDDLAAIGVFDERGNHVGDLHGTDDKLASWVVATYEDYRAEAQSITDYLGGVARNKLSRGD